MNHDAFHRLSISLRHWVAFLGVRRLLATLIGLIAALGAGWFVLRPSSTPIEFALPSIAVASTTVETSDIHVHVVGAVKNPGVYEMPALSRVVDAVKAAGGSLSIADLEGINLAQTLMDAEQVLIPVRRVSRPRSTVAPRLRPRATPTSVAQSSQQSKVVNINTATASQLENLTGVGPATARAIISYRTSKGLFAKVEDLLNVPGIGPAKLAAMRSEVSVS